MSTARINLIGGSAYSTVGGIQAVNRRLVTDLAAHDFLRQAFFLWDNEATATAEGLAARERGLASFYSLRHRAFLFDLLRQSLRHPSDLWLCTHVNYAALVGLATCFSSRRMGVLVHASELDERLTWSKRFGLRRAGRVFAVSNFTKKKAIGLGVRPERVSVLYNGVDDPCPGYRPRFASKPSQTILFVGRLDERYKGQGDLLDAMVLLRRRLPDLRLVFVGGGRSLGEWKEEANRRNLSAVVEFRGHTTAAELSHAYEEAMLFAMPSQNEGFGLVYAEAMAHGLACVGSDYDAASEVIVHGETGYCVPAGNATALADAILTLVRSPQLREQFGRAGRQRFTANFTAACYRDRLIAAATGWRDAPG